MFSSVRTRMTLWYVSVLGVVLCAFSAGVYILLARSLYERMDARLEATLAATAAALKPAFVQESNTQKVTRAFEDLSFPNQTIAVLDAGGQVLAQNRAPGGPALRLPSSPFTRSQSMGSYELPETRPDADDSCRGMFRWVTPDSTSASYGVLVSESLEPLDEQLDTLLNTLYIAVPLSLVLAGVGGWLLARRSLAPVAAMSQRAQRISVENLEERLPVGNPRDELGHLAATFNELLARLSNSFAQQRQFMADASHQLRTPLSAIRTAAAVTLERKDRGNSEYREALTIIEQQSRRLTRTVEDMFVIARADAGYRTLQKSSFYLDELLTQTARAAVMLASQKSLQLEVRPLPEAPFYGDEDLLRQMVWNLLGNAIRHTPESGKVQVALEAGGKEYVITVMDTGGGIPVEIQPHIFERFYCGDQARSRPDASMGSGAGLGLPIARWIAKAHHGRLELQHSDATGSTFVVLLPHS